MKILFLALLMIAQVTQVAYGRDIQAGKWQLIGKKTEGYDSKTKHTTDKKVKCLKADWLQSNHDIIISTAKIMGDCKKIYDKKTGQGYKIKFTCKSDKSDAVGKNTDLVYDVSAISSKSFKASYVSKGLYNGKQWFEKSIVSGKYMGACLK